MSKQDQTEGGVITEIESETTVRDMPLYKVLIHNDDKTSMEFVIHILMRFFEKDQEQAMRLMLDVHEKGMGLAGIYPLEHAEFRVDQATSLARANKFPLTLSIEPE